ncbi:MAG: nucleolar protein 8, partial [Parcubacteria group bacterium Athens0714_25]
MKGRGFSDAIRPSIKNWIDDYYHEMGAGKHDLMQRGDYLYHGKNAKNLSAEERQKMMAIIKSLEDGELMDIDQEEKKVIFPEYKDRKMPIKEGSLKSNFHKFFPVSKPAVKKEESSGNAERIKPVKKVEEEPAGLAKLNRKIQEEAVVSGGYSIMDKKEKNNQLGVEAEMAKREKEKQAEKILEIEKQKKAEQQDIEKRKERKEKEEAEKKLAEEIERGKIERERKEAAQKEDERKRQQKKEDDE